MLLCLTAQLLFPQSFFLLLRHLQGWRAEVGHDHEELLKVDLLKGAYHVLMLIPVSQKKLVTINYILTHVTF